MNRRAALATIAALLFGGPATANGAEPSPHPYPRRYRRRYRVRIVRDPPGLKWQVLPEAVPANAFPDGPPVDVSQFKPAPRTMHEVTPAQARAYCIRHGLECGGP